MYSAKLKFSTVDTGLHTCSCPLTKNCEGEDEDIKATIVKASIVAFVTIVEVLGMVPIILFVGINIWEIVDSEKDEKEECFVCVVYDL